MDRAERGGLPIGLIKSGPSRRSIRLKFAARGAGTDRKDAVVQCIVGYFKMEGSQGGAKERNENPSSIQNEDVRHH